MSRRRITELYNIERFRNEAGRFLSLLSTAQSLDEARENLSLHIASEHYEAYQSAVTSDGSFLYTVRDCARALRGMLHKHADERSGFSVSQALWDVAKKTPRPDLSAAFFADLTHLFIGLEGRFNMAPASFYVDKKPTGRDAALIRSADLDTLWSNVEMIMHRYADGLDKKTITERTANREHIKKALGASSDDFDNWQWQIANIAKNADSLSKMVFLSQEEKNAISLARRRKLPFGVTPYYASLMDSNCSLKQDRALRFQVIPPLDYVEKMQEGRVRGDCSFDFMLEQDTSPVDLITRRYPAIVILKPFNTCPQICVYCQRNWEIEDSMVDNALASSEKLEQAFNFIETHTAIKEVLITGGDPLGLPDDQLLPILERIASIHHIDLIRIGTRTLVTMPMRITKALASALGKLRYPGKREIAVMTHVQYPYEITPDMVNAVNNLRNNAVPVYNQLVYTFFVSRRFEAAKLRMLLRRIGIDPYYTFTPKGKTETQTYRVPLARIIQEQKEEARLLPGSRRTDEPVFNVPGLGKNHIRAFQHRDLISILPDGSRVYDFHPWEKGIAVQDNYVGQDVPILEYLQRLQDIGEDLSEYESIWYYF